MNKHNRRSRCRVIIRQIEIKQQRVVVDTGVLDALDNLRLRLCGKDGCHKDEQQCCGKSCYHGCVLRSSLEAHGYQPEA